MVAEECDRSKEWTAEARRLRLRVSELEAALDEDDLEFERLHRAPTRAPPALHPASLGPMYCTPPCLLLLMYQQGCAAQLALAVPGPKPPAAPAALQHIPVTGGTLSGLTGRRRQLGCLWRHAGELALAAPADGGGGRDVLAPSQAAEARLGEEVAALRARAEAAAASLRQERQRRRRAECDLAAARARASEARAIAAARGSGDGGAPPPALAAPLQALAAALPDLLAVVPRLRELPVHMDAAQWAGAEARRCLPGPCMLAGACTACCLLLLQLHRLLGWIFQGSTCVVSAFWPGRPAGEPDPCLSSSRHAARRACRLGAQRAVRTLVAGQDRRLAAFEGSLAAMELQLDNAAAAAEAAAAAAGAGAAPRPASRAPAARPAPGRHAGPRRAPAAAVVGQLGAAGAATGPGMAPACAAPPGAAGMPAPAAGARAGGAAPALRPGLGAVPAGTATGKRGRERARGAVPGSATQQGAAKRPRAATASGLPGHLQAGARAALAEAAARVAAARGGVAARLGSGASHLVLALPSPGAADREPIVFTQRPAQPRAAAAGSEPPMLAAALPDLPSKRRAPQGQRRRPAAAAPAGGREAMAAGAPGAAAGEAPGAGGSQPGCASVQMQPGAHGEAGADANAGSSGAQAPQVAGGTLSGAAVQSLPALPAAGVGAGGGAAGAWPPAAGGPGGPTGGSGGAAAQPLSASQGTAGAAAGAGAAVNAPGRAASSQDGAAAQPPPAAGSAAGPTAGAAQRQAVAHYGDAAVVHSSAAALVLPAADVKPGAGVGAGAGPAGGEEAAGAGAAALADPVLASRSLLQPSWCLLRMMPTGSPRADRALDLTPLPSAASQSALCAA